MDGLARPVAIDLNLWDAWRPEDAARILGDVRAPWYVAAGWAIDLFLGEGQRREHGDLEIAVPRHRFGEVAAALGDYDLYVPDGELGVQLVWPAAWADEALKEHHQTWVRERGGGAWRLDVFREPSDGDTWICRRDESIRLPYSDVIAHTANGIPYARPEINLLFKAKHAHQEKDAGDFEAVLPRLEPSRRRWLGSALARVHPGHAWIERLA